MRVAEKILESHSVIVRKEDALDCKFKPLAMRRDRLPPVERPGGQMIGRPALDFRYDEDARKIGYNPCPDVYVENAKDEPHERLIKMSRRGGELPYAATAGLRHLDSSRATFGLTRRA